MTERDEASLALARMRELLLSLPRQETDTDGKIRDLIELTVKLEFYLRRWDSGQGQVQSASSKTSGRRRRGEAVSGYVIREDGKEQSLEENRGGNTPPFRVPKRVYTAVSRAIGQSDGPLRFGDGVMKAVKKQITDFGEYHVRTCLRFLQHEKLVERNRATYKSRVEDLEEQAEQAWEKLLKAS